MSSTSTSVTTGQRRLLDQLVTVVPPNLDMLFGMYALPDEERGACATYSRMLAEVLGEFGIRAVVRPVYVETINRVAFDAVEGKITKQEAIRRGARIQIWGDIKEGQSYQHAVCYLPGWDVVVDLAMSRRASGLVPSHPYWAEARELPWWIARFEFRTYPLEYYGYEAEREKVSRGKEFIRGIVREYRES